MLSYLELSRSGAKCTRADDGTSSPELLCSCCASSPLLPEVWRIPMRPAIALSAVHRRATGGLQLAWAHKGTVSGVPDRPTWRCKPVRQWGCMPSAQSRRRVAPAGLGIQPLLPRRAACSACLVDQQQLLCFARRPIALCRGCHTSVNTAASTLVQLAKVAILDSRASKRARLLPARHKSGECAFPAAWTTRTHTTGAAPGSAHYAGLSSTMEDDDRTSVKEQDRFLPIANISRIMVIPTPLQASRQC